MNRILLQRVPYCRRGSREGVFAYCPTQSQLDTGYNALPYSFLILAMLEIMPILYEYRKLGLSPLIARHGVCAQSMAAAR